MDPNQTPNPQPIAPTPAPVPAQTPAPQQQTPPPITPEVAPQQPIAPAPASVVQPQPVGVVPSAAPMVAPAVATSVPPSGNKKLIFIIVGIVVLLLLIGGAVALSTSKMDSSKDTPTKPVITQKSADTTPSRATAAPAATTATTPTATAASGDKLVTLCYSFVLPTPHDPTDGSNSCDQKVRFGTKVTGSINVSAPTVQYATFAENVDEVKNTHKYDTIISQKDSTLGGLKAYEIVYSSGTSGKGIVFKEIVADVAGRGYTQSGVKLTAISTYAKYQDDEYTTKAQYDTVINSFTWK